MRRARPSRTLRRHLPDSRDTLQRYVLNVQKKAAEEVLSELEDHSHGETDEVTRGEVEKAVGKLCNGKAAGQDEVVAELLKY